jgi:hypothetical protein
MVHPIVARHKVPRSLFADRPDAVPAAFDATGLGGVPAGINLGLLLDLEKVFTLPELRASLAATRA